MLECPYAQECWRAHPSGEVPQGGDSAAGALFFLGPLVFRGAFPHYQRIPIGFAKTPPWGRLSIRYSHTSSVRGVRLLGCSQRGDWLECEVDVGQEG